MRTSLLSALFVGVVMASGCEAPAVGWGWFPWPHHVVEDHYVVEDEHVHITDHHYPLYERANPCATTTRPAPRLVQARRLR